MRPQSTPFPCARPAGWPTRRHAQLAGPMSGPRALPTGRWGYPAPSGQSAHSSDAARSAPRLQLASDRLLIIARACPTSPATSHRAAPAAHQFGSASSPIKSSTRRAIGSSPRANTVKVEAAAQMEVRSCGAAQQLMPPLRAELTPAVQDYCLVGLPAPIADARRGCSRLGMVSDSAALWQVTEKLLQRSMPPALPTATATPCCAGLLQGFKVATKPTKPIEGQKTGTSGLRKKTKEFTSDNYLANWCGQRVGGHTERTSGSGCGGVAHRLCSIRGAPELAGLQERCRARPSLQALGLASTAHCRICN